MKLTARHYGIIVFTLATALLHLSLFTSSGFTDPVFLNGFGYLALLLAYFLPMAFFRKYHKWFWWLLTGYTVLTFVLWIFLGNHVFVFGTYSATGFYAKTAEILLLICLWLDRPFGRNAQAAAQ
jgi:hypothetical protein